ncbi:MAG: peptide chain release factor N(5)-glutamine methyltransferase [Ectothiorhodospiraceae bacterium]|nr:peptide chain release factor N(5)-glutamine methyltransferase [Ectothiorhodospiraceae bacterium]
MTLGELLRESASLLAGVSDSPRLDAELLGCHVLGVDRSLCFSRPEYPLSTREASAIRALLARRLAGEPVAYLLGRRGFWTLDLAVNPDVLIPRPETELLVERCLTHIPPASPRDLCDLGTGSGAIALALASERPECHITAVDRSEASLAVARSNGELCRLRVEWLQGDWFAPLSGRRFHLIASNPPYVAEDDPHLEQGDIRHEPRQALVAGPDGLAALRLIIRQAPAHLRAGGWLVLEHGHDQAQAVRALLQGAGFTELACHRDLAGLPRISEGRYGGGTADE